MARPKKDRLIPPAENVITVLRMRNGLTQQQLADACGLTVIDVGKMERKDYKLQLCKLQTLAAFFRISLDTIVHDRLDLALANLRAPCEVDQDTKLKLRSMQLKRLDTGLHGEDLVYEQERQKLAGTPVDEMSGSRSVTDAVGESLESKYGDGSNGSVGGGGA
jgi:transcriptional regulator with XRE-family HTH domain